MPTYKTKGELRSELLIKLGYGGLGAAAGNFVPMADGLLEEAQEQLFILMPDEKRIREWEFNTGVSQRWYDFPADCDIDRIIKISTYVTDTWQKVYRGIDIYHDSIIDQVNDWPQRYDIRWQPNDLELQQNNDFSTEDTSATGTGSAGFTWVTDTWEITGGVLQQATPLLPGCVATSTTTLTIGNTYDIAYTIGGKDMLTIQFGGAINDDSGLPLGKTVGSHTHRVTAVSTQAFVFLANNISPITTVDNVSINHVHANTGREMLELWPIDDTDSYLTKIEGYIKLSPFVSDNHRATIDDRLVLLHAEAYGKAHLNRPDAQLKMQALQARLRILRGQQHGETRYIRGEKPENPVPIPRVVS